MSVYVYSATGVDLTPYIGTIENSPADQILNYGLHVAATTPISAYYENLGGIGCNYCNPEIFSLKGRNALGTSFFIPMQQTFANNTTYLPLPYSSFVVVATEDNTTVTITPTQALVGHPANASYTIFLNKGQTYSATAASAAAADHPSGSTVTSDKPIAITVSDDEVQGNHGDVAGDQLIPVAKIGTEYIAVKSPSAYNDVAVIVATQNNTQVNVNGALVATLNAGETFQQPLGANDAIYITSSSPIYVLQLTTPSGEPGAAVLPPLPCTGSREVSVMRSTIQPFVLFVITQTTNIADFLFNGATGVIQPTDFLPVPGTTGTWQYASLDLSATATVGSNIRISNTTGIFHLAMMQGLLGGSGYAFFSDFVYNSSVTDTVCTIASHTLISSFPNANYLWSNGSTADTLLVSQSGTYWVKNTFATCSVTDTFHITIGIPPAPFSIGDDTLICPGTSVNLQAPTGFDSYVWQNGATTTQINASTPGLYYVNVTSMCGVMSDSAIIGYNAGAVIDLGSDTTLCPGITLVLDASAPPVAYEWQNGSTGSTLTVSQPGTYWVHVTDGSQCETADTIVINYAAPLTADIGSDTTACVTEDLVLNAQTSGITSYLWHNGSTESSLDVTQAGTYWVLVSDVHSCTAADTVDVSIQSPAPVYLGPDTFVCRGETITLIPEMATAAVYVWQDGSTAANFAVSTAGTYSVQAWDGVCYSRDSVNIGIEVSPLSLGDDTFLCNNAILLSAPEGPYSYLWQNGGSERTLSATQPGIYSVTISQPGHCAFFDSVHILVSCPDMVFPNAFSPNSDGINDGFGPLLYEFVSGFKLSIFNRWGELVYKSDNPADKWDGTYNDLQCEIGVYVWFASYRLIEQSMEQAKTQKGNVVLLR